MGAIAEAIAREVLAWPEMESAPHRFGGVEFRLRGREIGHLHGDRLADLPFPARMRDEILASGRAEPHHILPESGWVSCWIRGEEDAANVVSLLRMQYDRVMARA